MNLGLYDIVTFLEWLNSNIASFGGNKRRITIAGVESGKLLGLLFFWLSSCCPLVSALDILLFPICTYIKITWNVNIDFSLIKCMCFWCRCDFCEVFAAVT